MITRDLIVEEVRETREAYAARFNYDIDAMFDDIVRHEKLRLAHGGRIEIPQLPPQPQSLTPNV